MQPSARARRTRCWARDALPQLHLILGSRNPTPKEALSPSRSSTLQDLRCCGDLPYVSPRRDATGPRRSCMLRWTSKIPGAPSGKICRPVKQNWDALGCVAGSAPFSALDSWVTPDRASPRHFPYLIGDRVGVRRFLTAQKCGAERRDLRDPTESGRRLARRNAGNAPIEAETASVAVGPRDPARRKKYSYITSAPVAAPLSSTSFELVPPPHPRTSPGPARLQIGWRGWGMAMSARDEIQSGISAVPACPLSHKARSSTGSSHLLLLCILANTLTLALTLLTELD